MRILVVGGTGGFGRTICTLLADDGHDVVAASRGMPDDQPKRIAHVVLDRASITTVALAPYDLVVDAAGPFQGLGLELPETCIAAGVHYVDISDDRDFVHRLVTLDAAARAAGVILVSGASSIPAISSAAIATLVNGLPGEAAIRGVNVAISASSQAVFGRSVLTAMLSGAGRAIPDQKGRTAMLDQGTMRARSSRGDLERTVLSCDAPIRDGLARLIGDAPVSFRAGSELRVHNASMRLIARLVRMGILRSGVTVRPIAALARRLTAGLGSGRSAMVVEVRADHGKRRILRAWSLVAERNRGPLIPCLVVPAVVDEIAVGGMPVGARSAGGTMTLSSILERLPDEDFEVATTDEEEKPLYRRILGDRWHDLPPSVREMHDPIGRMTASGRADVVRGASPLARLVAWIFGFPSAGADVPVRVEFDAVDGLERWTRTFGGRSFISVLSQSGYLIEERFGPMRFRFQLVANRFGLSMMPVSWSFLGLPLPRRLMPDGIATESGEKGVFRFDVPIRMPLIGLVVHYTGHLRINR